MGMTDVLLKIKNPQNPALTLDSLRQTLQKALLRL